MARNKSERLPSCPAAIAYADAVDAGRPSGLDLRDMWVVIPASFQNAIADERRLRKTERGPKYFSDLLDPDKRDYVINAEIIREWYGP